jgi:energy-converting hydrogenase Eha subunit F
LSRSKYRSRTSRRANIIMTIFSIIVVISFILGLLGPEVFRSSGNPTPIPTRVIPTAEPLLSPTPLASPTGTAGVPTPVIVTPTPDQ